MVPVQRDHGQDWNATQQLDAGDDRRQHRVIRKDSLMEKHKEEGVNATGSSHRVDMPHTSKPNIQVFRPPAFRSAETGSTLCASDLLVSAPMILSSRDQPMRYQQQQTPNAGSGVLNSVPWKAASSKCCLNDTTGWLMCLPSSFSVLAEPPAWKQQKGKHRMGQQQRTFYTSTETSEPASSPSDKLSIIEKARTDPDGFIAMHLQ